ncbi:uncharacterized protein [Diadema setosum]|uniref:uncharacterized protein n=1 Tax=Diadema setosum TaxID=31175 RepID=UPI003B3A6A45
MLGHTLIQHLLLQDQPACAENNCLLYQLYISCLQERVTSLDSICETVAVQSLDSNAVDEKVQSIHHLLNFFDPPPSILVSLRTSVENAFTNLLRLARRHPKVLCQATLSAALVGRESDALQEVFSLVQSKVRWESLEGALTQSKPQLLQYMCPELRIFLSLSCLNDREEAWRNLIHWAIEKGHHILGNIVDFSMILIREKMYTELGFLLRPEELSQLKPLVLLLGWSHVDSCSAANSLLDVLWRNQPSPKEEDLLQQSCQRLHSDVQLIQWCLDKARPLIAEYGGEAGLEARIMALFQGADFHSVLRLLHHFSCLSKLDPKDVFHVLTSRPQLESSPVNGGEKKTVRFASEEDEASLKQIMCEQKRDSAIYTSFLIVQNVMLAVVYSACQPPSNDAVATETSAPNAERPVPSVQVLEGSEESLTNGSSSKSLDAAAEDEPQHSNCQRVGGGKETVVGESWETAVVDRLKTAKEQLAGLNPLTYRVEILEDLFSLLFARSEDIYRPELEALVASDSDHEEGHLDEDWVNTSFTSLESVESPLKEGSLLTEFTFSRSASLDVEKRTSARKSTRRTLSLGPLGSSQTEVHLSPSEECSQSLTEPSPALQSVDERGLGKGKGQAVNGIEITSHQNFPLVSKVGFLASRRFMQVYLDMLKECMDNVNAVKLSLLGPGAPSQTTGNKSADFGLEAHLESSVTQTQLARRIAQLSKRINEARWRFQLVSSQQTSSKEGQGDLVDDDCSILEVEEEEEEVFKTFFEVRTNGERTRKKRKRTTSRQSSSRSRSASGWSSSEAGSGNHSARSHSHLSAEPTSAGTTDGNGLSGSERRRRKKRRSSCRADTSAPRPRRDCGIVAQMLASEDALLRMCLRRENFTQAGQVIKIFDMENKQEVAEVHFASHWQRAVKRLKSMDSTGMVSGPQTQTPGLKSGLGGIASMAAAGIASFSMTEIIDELLMHATLPILPVPQPASGSNASSSSPSQSGGNVLLWQQLQNVNVIAMVVFDLACTACHSWKTCTELLDMVVSRLQSGLLAPSPSTPNVVVTSPSQYVSSPKAGCPTETLLGVKAFMQQMHSLINPVSSTATALIRPNVLEYFQRSALQALTMAISPLDPSTLRSHVNFVLEVRQGIQLLSSALHSFHADIDSGLSDFSPPATSSPKRGPRGSSGSETPEKSRQKVSEICRAVQQLLRALDRNVLPSFMMAFPKLTSAGKAEQAINPANYLLTVYNHLSVLASLAVDARDWQPGSERQLGVEKDQCQNPFSILAESPCTLMGRLMFSSHIPPVRLEGVADELKLNLVQIIIQSCCRTIPMLPRLATLPPPKEAAGSARGSHVLVLNELGVSGEWPHPVRTPIAVVTELLDKVVALMTRHASGEGLSATLDLSGAATAAAAPEYWDIFMSTRELMHVDLDLLQSNEDRLCFFANLLNLMLTHAALHHASQQGSNFSMGPTRHFSLGRGITSPSGMLLSPPGINSGSVTAQLVYLSSRAYKVGQMGVVSAFDLHFTILRANLPVPLVYGEILQHRLHALGDDDPWLKYIPAPDPRVTFVSCNGSLSSPRLRVLSTDDFDEQLTVAMQNYLDANVKVDEENNEISIPQCMDWFRKDFTGSTLPTNVHHGHIYMGLLHVIQPHVSQYLGDKLENYTMKFLPRHIEVESSGEAVAKTADPEAGRRKTIQRSNSVKFKLVVTPYNHSFGFRFFNVPGIKAKASSHRRNLSVPKNFETVVSSPGDEEDHPDQPPFQMTESTLKYLHAKSKLVASLAGAISGTIEEGVDTFAKDKSIDEDLLLLSSGGTPKSLVFEETFGSDRVYNPCLSTLTKVLQHLAGYPVVQQYVQAFFGEVLAMAESFQESCSANMREVRASLLADVRSRGVQDLLREAVEILVSACQWDAVLRLVGLARSLVGDQDLYRALADFAAYCAGNQVKPVQESAPSTKPTWQCLLTIKDEVLRGRAVLASLDSLPIEAALELLECCESHSGRESAVQAVLNTKLQQLRIYKEITVHAMQQASVLPLEVPQDEGEEESDEPWQATRPLSTWQDVQAESKTRPDYVLKLLISAANFKLAREWAELHNVLDDYQQTIQTKYLEHLLISGTENLRVYQLIKELPSSEETVAICSELLESQKLALTSVVFLVQFLLTDHLADISYERAGELRDIGIGAKVLLCLPERVRGEYQDLMSRPDLLLEQLLMNLKVNLASDVQSTLQEELKESGFPSATLSQTSINALISKYAREAIRIPVILHNTSLSDTDSLLNHSLSIASYASTLSPPGMSSAGRGRQFLSSFRARPPSPSPSTISAASTTSSSVPIPDRRRKIIKGPQPSPTVTTPLPRRSSRDNLTGQVGDQFASPPTISVLPNVPEKPVTLSAPAEFQLPSVPPPRSKWVPDDRVTNCMVCQDRFSMFNRRHHCRRCGRVVCWKCSQLRAIVDGYGDTPVRICDQCYEKFITPRPSATSQSLERRIKEKFSGGHGSPSSSRNSPVSRSQTPMRTPEFSLGGQGLAESQYNLVSDWRLTLEAAHNEIVREDFYYEQAPSTSLCLSILELHSDPGACGHLLLQLCQELSEYLRPIRPGETNAEVDYNLVLSMMRNLLLNSKLKFLGSGDGSSLELCDTYLGHVDLLSLFVSSNCPDVPSIQQLTTPDKARRIRDKLVLAERLSLAMEVSTKCGLEPGAVWAAWGLSCLQAGDYQGAREKFSRILKVPADKNQTQGPNQLLQDIIHTLELSANQTLRAHDILGMSTTSIKDFISIVPKTTPDMDTSLENLALKECLHYIQTYGSHLTTVQFLMRHGKMTTAINHLLQEQCPSELFVEAVLVPCIKEGQFAQLQDAMLKVDPTLVRWHPHLTASCRHIKRLGWSRVLYQLQLFMKDFVRAAMTCIKFFQTGATSYSALFERLHHVQRAKDHLRAVMEDKQWGSVPRPAAMGSSPRSMSAAGSQANIRFTLSPSELTKHMNTISLQIEVTTFLHRALGKNSLMPPTPPTQTSATPTSARRPSDVGGGGTPPPAVPTLFGNSTDKAEVVHKVLLAGSTVADGFQLAFKIIQDFRLAETKIYCRAGRRLALLKKHGEIKQLLMCHKSTGLANRESCDEILDASVRALASDKTQVKGAEELIKLMQGETSKINAFILIGRLKQAYLLAVKAEREDDIRRIAATAEQTEGAEARIKSICDTWLREREAKRRSAEQAQQLLARSRTSRP